MALTAVDALKSYSNIKVCTVVGFPHGNISLALKSKEAQHFIGHGVDEIDFVANVGLLKSERYEEVGAELETMGQVCHDNNVVSKCIIETCYLTREEKTFMYRALAERTLVNFIKTSTGYGPEGAQAEDVFDWNQRREQSRELTQADGEPIILENSREPLKIKAAGGIKDLGSALRFIGCGADRLGMSASVKVVEEWNARDRTFIEGEEAT